MIKCFLAKNLPQNWYIFIDSYLLVFLLQIFHHFHTHMYNKALLLVLYSNFLKCVNYFSASSVSEWERELQSNWRVFRTQCGDSEASMSVVATLSLRLDWWFKVLPFSSSSLGKNLQLTAEIMAKLLLFQMTTMFCGIFCCPCRSAELIKNLLLSLVVVFVARMILKLLLSLFQGEVKKKKRNNYFQLLFN